MVESLPSKRIAYADILRNKEKLATLYVGEKTETYGVGERING